MSVQVKIIEVNSNVPAQIENAINSWIDDREFKTLEVQHIVEYSPPKIGTRIYVLYELKEEQYPRDAEESQELQELQEVGE
jgi:hypothetical protein